MKKQKVANAPGLHVIIKLDQGKVQNIKLESAPNFTLSCNEAYPQPILNWLKAYAEHKPLPLSMDWFDWDSLTPFTKNVLLQLGKVHFSATHSYADIAKLIKKSKAYRAVGGACARNPFALFIPCHRILASDGKLGGFAFGLELKHHLLEFEALASHSK